MKRFFRTIGASGPAPLAEAAKTKGIFSSSAFRRSLPVTLTAFLNKSGTIGLSIVPVLLVERHVSSGASAAVMGAIKAAGLAGVLIGGRLCDRLGLRATLLLSFLISGLGMLPLPFVEGALLLGLCAAVSQLGTSFYYASGRLLVTQLVEPAERPEAIAWQRTASNLAQIISYSLGAALGRFGTTFLLLFDAFTSFLATGVGARILPDRNAAKPAPAPGDGQGTRLDFFRGAAIVALFSFLYEMYMAAAAAKCKLLFGTQGLPIFSQLMVINTLLCAAFAVYAAKYLRRAERTMPLGLALLALGCFATFAGPGAKEWFFAGALLVTLGEIVFNAMAGMVLIVITPAGARQASLYSQGVLLQFLGRITGASAAFPLVVHGTHPLLATLVGAFASLALCFTSRHVLARAG